MGNCKSKNKKNNIISENISTQTNIDKEVKNSNALVDKSQLNTSSQADTNLSQLDTNNENNFKSSSDNNLNKTNSKNFSTKNDDTILNKSNSKNRYFRRLLTTSPSEKDVKEIESADKKAKKHQTKIKTENNVDTLWKEEVSYTKKTEKEDTDSSEDIKIMKKGNNEMVCEEVENGIRNGEKGNDDNKKMENKTHKNKINNNFDNDIDTKSYNYFKQLIPHGNTQYIAFGLPEQDEHIQMQFQEKPFIIHGNANNEFQQKIGFSHSCRKGLKPDTPNQDDFCFLRSDNWGFYGVFDGHGPHGHLISQFVHHLLPQIILSNPLLQTDPKSVLISAFSHVQSQLEQYKNVLAKDLDVDTSGTTATVILQQNNIIYSAHVGDSRAVLGQKMENGEYVAFDLTNDHKPNRPDEEKRIIESGGEVKQLIGDVPFRVFVKNLSYPGLAMSRALGDLIGMTVGVIPVPEVSETPITSKDAFIVISSDGVWEFLSSQKIVDIVAKRQKNGCKSAVDTIVKKSWKCWIQEEETTVDDITCMAIWLI